MGETLQRRGFMRKDLFPFRTPPQTRQLQGPKPTLETEPKALFLKAALELFPCGSVVEH